MATCAPSWARACAIGLPSSPLPPVITTVCPCMLKSDCRFVIYVTIPIHVWCCQADGLRFRVRRENFGKIVLKMRHKYFGSEQGKRATGRPRGSPHTHQLKATLQVDRKGQPYYR